jgi:hypothetical protein
VNPFPLCPNALHNDFWLCAPTATHARSPKPRASPLSLRSCYLSCTHPDIPLLTIAHTQSASLSQCCTTSFAHVRITIASHSHCLLEHSFRCAICAICRAAITFAELCQSGSAHRFRAMHAACAHLLRCPLRFPHSATTLIWLLCTSDHQRFAGSFFDKQRYKLERVLDQETTVSACCCVEKCYRKIM